MPVSIVKAAVARPAWDLTPREGFLTYLVCNNTQARYLVKYYDPVKQIVELRGKHTPTLRHPVTPEMKRDYSICREVVPKQDEGASS